MSAQKTSADDTFKLPASQTIQLLLTAGGILVYAGFLLIKLLLEAERCTRQLQWLFNKERTNSSKGLILSHRSVTRGHELHRQAEALEAAKPTSDKPPHRAC